jgi:hypothetical protein
MPELGADVCLHEERRLEEYVDVLRPGDLGEDIEIDVHPQHRSELDRMAGAVHQLPGTKQNGVHDALRHRDRRA